MTDPLHQAIATGTVRALRKRADLVRRRASEGVTIIDHDPPVVAISSEAATLFRIAKHIDALAAAVEEAEAP